MKNPLSLLSANSYFKSLLVTAILLVTVCRSSAQDLWGVLAKGGTDGLGTLGHYSVSTSSWIVDYNFTIENSVSGLNPTTELTEANGKFYGLAAGGANNVGELFEWDQHTNIYTTKINFSLALGSSPQGALTYAAGKLYGMTSGGGLKKGGTLFSWDPATGVFKKLWDLEAHPKGSLTEVNGKLYGMTNVIFEWDIASNVYTKKADISCDNGCDLRGRLAYVNGKFYGVTVLGGVNGVGAIFEWDPVANVITKKIDMSVVNGSSTYGSLTSKDGKLYGMTFKGGSHNAGVIFEWDPSTNIYVNKLNLGAVHLGRNPKGSLIVVDNKFYGLTSGGGENRGGSLFEWDASTNIFLVKVSFDGVLFASNGKNPRGSLAFSDGKFYGMTYWGGIANQGVLFEWDPSTNIYTKKINFWATTYTGRNSTGSLLYNNGKLYGITQGGVNNAGGVFKWDLYTHQYSRKIDFKDDGSGNEFFPQGSLSKGIDKLYGTTKDVENFYGQLFECDLEANSFTTDFNFNCNYDIGCGPGPLTFVNGKFYGTTSNDGIANLGTLYEWNPTTNQYIKKVDFNGDDGSNPNGSLTYHEGVLYGMTNTGGINNAGVIFSWDPVNNSYTKKVDLSIADGSSPLGAVTFHDGKFYGMTYAGGANDAGVIFEWDPISNAYKKKVDLTVLNGSAPKGSLTYSGNKFYGVTSSGGANGLGALFEWSPVTNVYTKKIDFNNSTGGAPGYVQLVEVSLSDVYLIKPGNGAVNQMVKITLKAKPVDGATTYTYEVSTNQNFVNPKIINGGSTQLIDSLHYNTLYYVHVKTNLRPDYGKVTTFTTRTAESLAYVTWPGDGVVNVPTSTAIASNSVPYASTYTIQLSETADFSVVAFELTGPSRILHFTGLKNSTTYYSRVRVNLSAAFGAVKSFSTQDASSSRTSSNASETELKDFVVTVYPNPFQEKISVYIASEHDDAATVTLMDLNGRKVHESEEQTNAAIEIKKIFSSGIYVLKIKSGMATKLIRVVSVP